METVTLKTVPTRMVLAFLLSLGFVALDFILLRDADIPAVLRLTIGWVPILFFGLAALVSLLSLRPGAYCLRLRKEGFEIKTPLRLHFYRWEDVESFSVYSGSRVAWKNAIFIRLAPSAKRSAVRKALNAASRELFGFDGMLPAIYEIKGEQLLSLLNRWKAESET
jgi:hypothetical protein